MSNNKQSSVEWLIEQLKARHREGNPNSCAIENYFVANADLVKQAKAMHKEEIVKSNEAGFDDGIGFIEEIKYKNAEDYYIKTFGGNNGHI